ncbi:MAG TPA: hypothetical protein DEP87_03085 [Candidatus Pacebacteria bacterium]|nr:hypothetical protein [Candidatus Paceibacterota bacterium]
MIPKDNFIHLPEEVTGQLEPEAADKAVDWLMFNLDDQILIVKLESVIKQPPELQVLNPNSNSIKIHVTSQFGELLATFYGQIVIDKIDGKSIFLSKGFHNNTIAELPNDKIKKNPNYIPGVIRATIKELILRGGIMEWRSSAASRLIGGTLTYEALCRDPDLNAKKLRLSDDPDGSKCFRYILSKATKPNMAQKIVRALFQPK